MPRDSSGSSCNYKSNSAMEMQKQAQGGRDWNPRMHVIFLACSNWTSATWETHGLRTALCAQLTANSQTHQNQNFSNLAAFRPSQSTTSFPQPNRRHNQPAIDSPRSVRDHPLHDDNFSIEDLCVNWKKSEAPPKILTFPRLKQADSWAKWHPDLPSRSWVPMARPLRPPTPSLPSSPPPSVLISSRRCTRESPRTSASPMP